jgi:osmotically-inducible protein OsmY
MRYSRHTSIGLTLMCLTMLTSGCAPLLVAGVGTGAIMADDRRTNGAFVEDEVIENKVQGRINQSYGYSAHINAVSFNGNVLLAGQVPNYSVKDGIEALAREVAHVHHIYNEAQIAPIISLSTRSTDSYITSKIKARFLEAQRFGINHVKVYTEDSVVFLLGLVSREEADIAADIARTTNGVKKVVRLFEYGTYDNPKAARQYYDSNN